ncbi:hypothetical protein [Pseudomonas sp. LRF_L74]|uniref:hypothetical protein n=1 Tax=Pseudomonas sp. LRF_L74 TaxID=3369422 RepID=UPI003F61CA29
MGGRGRRTAIKQGLDNFYKAMKYTKGNFPELKSQANWFITWLVRILLGSVFVFFFLSSFAVPVLLYMEEEISVVVMVVYYPLIVWGYVAIVRQMKKANYVGGITVNKKGLRFHKANGETETISYAQLHCSNDRYTDDVYVKTLIKGGIIFFVHMNGNKKMIDFKMDATLTYYAGNHKELRAHFIQGIQLFRPDLHISSFVYSKFFIRPDTFEFDKQEYRKTIIAIIALIVLVSLGIELWMRYQFGHSLLGK